jgi:hypothetical protein
MKITFYKRAIPDDLEHGAYDSPLLTVDFPSNWHGTYSDALQEARKQFKDFAGCSEAEFGAFHRFE